MKKGLFIIASLLMAAVLIVWFIAAHLIKGQVVKFIDNLNNDNFKVRYESVSVSGFPFKWVIRISEPNFTTIDSAGTQDYRTSIVEMHLSPHFKTIKLFFDNEVDITLNKESSDGGIKYEMRTPNVINAVAKFDQSLIFITPNMHELEIALKYLKIAIADIELESDGVKISELKDSYLELRRLAKTDDSNSKRLQVKVDYAGADQIFAFSSVNLDTDLEITKMSYKEESKKRSYYGQLKVNEFKMNLNGDATLDINGIIATDKDKLPEGNFMVSAQNYPTLLDQLMRPSAIRTKNLLKTMLIEATKAESQEIQDPETNAKFTVHFAQHGIKLGGIEMQKLILQYLSSQ